MREKLLLFLIILRIMTNDGMFLENRRPLPKKLPPEVFRFIRKPAKRGRKLFFK
jgi:hypothetical protein